MAVSLINGVSSTLGFAQSKAKFNFSKIIFRKGDVEAKTKVFTGITQNINSYTIICGLSLIFKQKLLFFF